MATHNWADYLRVYLELLRAACGYLELLLVRYKIGTMFLGIRKVVWRVLVLVAWSEIIKYGSSKRNQTCCLCAWPRRLTEWEICFFEKAF